jgi:hypothetical protein
VAEGTDQRCGKRGKGQRGERPSASDPRSTHRRDMRGHAKDLPAAIAPPEDAKGGGLLPRRQTATLTRPFDARSPARPGRAGRSDIRSSGSR